MPAHAHVASINYITALTAALDEWQLFALQLQEFLASDTNVAVELVSMPAIC